MKIGPITAEIVVALPCFSLVRVGVLSITRIGPLKIVRCGTKLRIGLRR